MAALNRQSTRACSAADNLLLKLLVGILLQRVPASLRVLLLLLLSSVGVLLALLSGWWFGGAPTAPAMSRLTGWKLHRW